MVAPIDNKQVQKYLGWVGLGVCIDYFILKPIRLLRPFGLVAIGFGIGIFFIGTIERMAAFAKYLLGM